MSKYNRIIRPYINLKDIRDNRKFEFGSIWQIRDLLINIPNIDRLSKRTYHFSRCVVIIDNSLANFLEDSLLISVVPISHQVNCKRIFDIDLSVENDNVKQDSIMMLDYIQPILKKDLYKCVGNISEDKKHELLYMLMKKWGIKQAEDESASDIDEDNEDKEE